MSMQEMAEEARWRSRTWGAGRVLTISSQAVIESIRNWDWAHVGVGRCDSKPGAETFKV